MVSIASPSFDLLGNLLLSKTNLSEDKNQFRRVSRTATLDGGSSIQDLGFSHSDRTIRIISDRASDDNLDTAQYLQINYPLVTLANNEGVFLTAIESIDILNGQLVLTCLVKEKLTED
jgi:hypothetical protein